MIHRTVTHRAGSRLAAIGAPVLVAALVLGACGGSDSSSPSRETISLDTGSTAFITVPPATTTPPTLVAQDGTVQTEQLYTIQSGDWPGRIADLFEVTVEDIGNYNGWVACTALSCPEFPFPGTEIRIPPGGRSLDTAGGTADGVEAVTGGEVEQAAGDTIPEAGDNCQAGSYVIAEGDFPNRVAERFDVTVDALNAANIGTDGYSSFFIGLTIVIPAKDDCDAADTADE